MLSGSYSSHECLKHEKHFDILKVSNFGDACIKAYMKIYILLQTAAIFFLLNLYLKQGIGSVYVIVDFICKGDLELSGTQVERELQNENSCPL